MNTYTVRVTREDPYWVGVVDGLPGGATETRSLRALEGEVRDLIAGLTDSDEEEIELDWDYSAAVPGSVSAVIEQLTRARDDLAQARENYEHLQRDAVTGVRGEGVSVRDAAVLLDLSYQRISQLAS